MSTIYLFSLFCFLNSFRIFLSNTFKGLGSGVRRDILDHVEKRKKIVYRPY